MAHQIQLLKKSWDATKAHHTFSRASVYGMGAKFKRAEWSAAKVAQWKNSLRRHAGPDTVVRFCETECEDGGYVLYVTYSHDEALPAEAKSSTVIIKQNA
jgi:hypothetical protein